MARKSSKRNSLRIIGGHLRSRRVEFLEHEGLRPTGDRVRETLFNWLQNSIPAARCLDLFAGSGVLGIEALSRGAGSVDFVEADSKVVAQLQETIRTLQLRDAQVSRARAEEWLAESAKEDTKLYDVVFLDPPFADEQLPSICQLLNDSGKLQRAARVYIESDKPLAEGCIPVDWTELKSKKAGQVYFYLYECG